MASSLSRVRQLASIMTDRARRLNWPFTRDQTLGFVGAIVAIVAAGGAYLWYKARPPAGEAVLLQREERLHGASIRWFGFEIQRHGVVEIDAKTTRGERFALHVAKRPGPLARERGLSRMLPDFSSEEGSDYRRAAELTPGEYYIIVLRTTASATHDDIATLRLRVQHRAVPRRRRGRRRVDALFSARRIFRLPASLLAFVATSLASAAAERTADAPDVSMSAQTGAEHVTSSDRFSMNALAARLKNIFGPWRGRLALSTEAVVDSAERSSSSLEAVLRRKWSRDEVQFRGRYDYAETNEVTSSDVFRSSMSWRREFARTYFAHYQPGMEWNRASRRQGVPNDYVLVQQEIGAGLQLFTSATRKVRTGISHNRFDTWNTAPVADHLSASVQSIFEEVDLKFSRRIGLTQRGVWYPVPNRRDGWGGHIELNKKLTETLSIAFRYEVRRQNPDGSAQDYSKTKLLLGLDF